MLADMLFASAELITEKCTSIKKFFLSCSAGTGWTLIFLLKYDCACSDLVFGCRYIMQRHMNSVMPKLFADFAECFPVETSFVPATGVKLLGSLKLTQGSFPFIVASLSENTTAITMDIISIVYSIRKYLFSGTVLYKLYDLWYFGFCAYKLHGPWHSILAPWDCYRPFSVGILL